jgi:uncharacterized protein
MTEEKPKGKRGFASMSPEKVRAIASMGGKSVDPKKRSFAKNRKLAEEAGRKGGKATAPQNRQFAKDRDLAVDAGRKGGKARKHNEDA